MYESQKKDYQYFSDSFESLYREYPDKQLVIKNCKVIGVYDDFDTAYSRTLETEQLGSFIIQECKPVEQTQFVYHSNNVSFAVS